MNFELRVAGPDTIDVMTDELEALRRANAINKQYLADRAMHQDNEVLCVATVYAVDIGENLPELPTCTKSQTGDMRRCKACRETGAIHCSDPENCGGPWTVHLTPEINEECDHAWEGGADMSQERCSKCGLSFMRYVHSCCP